MVIYYVALGARSVHPIELDQEFKYVSLAKKKNVNSNSELSVQN